LKIFITEHPELLETIHKNLSKTLDEIEGILGPLANATDFQLPQSREESKYDESGKGKISSERKNECLEGDNKPALVLSVKNYSCILRSSSKKIDGFLELDISSTITRLAELRRAVITGSSDIYAQRLREDFEQNRDSIEAFDLEHK